MPETISFCIGYVGMTPYYHTIHLIQEPVPITKATVMERYKRIHPNVLRLTPKSTIKPHLNKRISTNYEGIGKNKK